MRRLAALALLLLAFVSPAVSAERKVSATLLVFSDIYEMSEQNGRGGFARVAGVLAAERAKSRNTLVAFAGDTLSPSLLSSLDKGAHIIDLHNRTKIDVFTPGNHEFDFGEDVFRTRMAELQAVRLAANLRDKDGKPLPGFADNKIFIMDGVKIGVFGLTEDESAKRSNTGTLRVSPAVETARAQAPISSSPSRIPTGRTICDSQKLATSTSSSRATTTISQSSTTAIPRSPKLRRTGRRSSPSI
jgi:5'-nucleotidase/UDP-sugar diphosphatase